MNLKHQFNRIGHLFDGGCEKSQAVAEAWAGKGIKRARTDLEKLVGNEEKMIRHMRANSTLYLVVAALIAGALIAKLLLESRDARQAPLL